MGWDLPIPKIEIDTRWGVPSYDGRERFLLQGSALVPIQPEADVSCLAQTGVTHIDQYATRNDTFMRILRCTVGSEISWWEVIDSSGTRFEYGTDNESRLANYYDDPKTPDVNECRTDVGIWYLRRVVDVNSNITEYRYQTDEDLIDKDTNTTDMCVSKLATPNGEPFAHKYLSEIK